MGDNNVQIQNSLFIQTLFHKTESYASVGRYCFSTMIIIQDIQTVCLNTSIFLSFHQVLIMILYNSSFTAKASCKPISSLKYFPFDCGACIYSNLAHLTFSPLRCVCNTRSEEERDAHLLGKKARCFQDLLHIVHKKRRKDAKLVYHLKLNKET